MFPAIGGGVKSPPGGAITSYAPRKKSFPIPKKISVVFGICCVAAIRILVSRVSNFCPKGVVTFSSNALTAQSEARQRHAIYSGRIFRAAR
jgi:hypothetical protein